MSFVVTAIVLFYSILFWYAEKYNRMARTVGNKRKSDSLDLKAKNRPVHA